MALGAFVPVRLLYLTMFALRVFVTAILVAGAVAQTSLTEALSEVPKCAVRFGAGLQYGMTLLTMVQTYCAVVQLIDAQCELTNFQQCLCSNTTLQSQVAGCAFYNCSIPDQGGMLALESLKPRPWSELLN